MLGFVSRCNSKRQRLTWPLEQPHELVVEVDCVCDFGCFRKRANFRLEALFCNILFHFHYDPGCLDAQTRVQEEARAYATFGDECVMAGGEGRGLRTVVVVVVVVIVVVVVVMMMIMPTCIADT